jgi:integrase
VSQVSEKKTRIRKPKSELESRVFKDGAIYLFRRADYKNPTWVCRIKVPDTKGYVVRSTGRADEHEAFAFASDLYNKTLVRVAGGQDLNPKKVTAAIREFVDHITLAEKKRRTTKTRSQFLTKSIAFFGSMALKDLNTAALAQFNDWMRQNSRRGDIAQSTVKRYSTDLKIFLNWCHERDYIDSVPRFPKVTFSQNRRPHFDEKDWTKLTRNLREFVKTPIPKVERDRKMLRDYVLILANTGVRVGEARNLRWRDLKEIPNPQDSSKLPDIAFEVRGKTGRREVVAGHANVRDYFRRLLELRSQELGRKPTNDDYVFCNRDGSPIGSLKKSFQSLLRFCDLEKDEHGQTRTIYSLRHTYATFRLQQGVHQFILAKNMGTSVAMLEKYYGHTSSIASAAELTKRGTFRRGNSAKAVEWLMDETNAE